MCNINCGYNQDMTQINNRDIILVSQHTSCVLETHLVFWQVQLTCSFKNSSPVSITKKRTLVKTQLDMSPTRNYVVT